MYIGEIRIFAGNFAPGGWAFCNGQLLSIAQNQALFSIVGTRFGGDGQVTFALPDMRGRFPLGAGAGPGLTPRTVGDRVGQETVALGVEHLPAHSHALQVGADVPAVDNDPEGKTFAAAPTEQYGLGTTVETAPATTAAGGGLPHYNVQPYLGLNFIILLQGYYPSRY